MAEAGPVRYLGCLVLRALLCHSGQRQVNSPMSAPGVRVTIGGAAGVHVSLCVVCPQGRKVCICWHLFYTYTKTHMVQTSEGVTVIRTQKSSLLKTCIRISTRGGYISQLSTRYLSKEMKRCPHRMLCMNIHSCLILSKSGKNPNVHPSIHRRMHKLNMVCLYNGSHSPI